MKKHEIKGGY